MAKKANKFETALAQVIQLYERHLQLTPAEIISELKSIRKLNGYIPGFPPGNQYDTAVYYIFKAIARSDSLTEKDAAEMSKILSWTEYDVVRSYGNILLAMERFPHRRYRQDLEDLIKRMSNRMELQNPVIDPKDPDKDRIPDKLRAQRLLAKCTKYIT